MDEQSYSHGTWFIATYGRFVRSTMTVNGRLEDSGHNQGKHASKLLDATTAFKLAVYSRIKEHVIHGNMKKP